MDKLKIGLVDLKNFLSFMNKSAVVKEAVVTDDNFDWQTFAIDRLREWTRRERLS